MKKLLSYMAHPYFEVTEYPTWRSEAQDFARVLTAVYRLPGRIDAVYRRCGPHLPPLLLNQAPDLIWEEALEHLTSRGALRNLCEIVLNDFSGNASITKAVQAIFDARAELHQNTEHPTAGAARSGQEDELQFIARADPITEPEALLFKNDLTIPISEIPTLRDTLQNMATLAPAVCKLTVDFADAALAGTGFRISKDRLLTNWHVLHRKSDEKPAKAVVAEFGYEDDGRGGLRTVKSIKCSPSTIVTSKADDWAVISFAESLDDVWPIVSLKEVAEPVVDGRAFIIQHPGGGRKRLGFVRNQVRFFDDRVAHYLTDTDLGSSGSPVFDSAGKLFALHHAGGRPQEIAGGALRVNEGIRISRVVQGLNSAGINPLKGGR